MKLNDEIRKENPFRVPEGYFDSLADRTMKAIRDEEAARSAADQAAGNDDSVMAPRTFKTGRTIRLKPFLALAAAIIGFAILAAVVVRMATAGSQAEGYRAGESLYADLAFEEVDTYMLENELSMTEPAETEITGEELSTEAIIDYLMNEGIDLDEIYELL